MNFLNYLRISVTVVAINQVGTLFVLCSAGELTGEPEPTPAPFICTYELTDIENVINTFYENKDTSKVVVAKIIKTEQTLVSEAACVKPWSEFVEYSEELCPEVSIGNASALQFDRYYGGNERAFELMNFEVQRMFYLTNQENSDSQCACEIKGRAINAMNKCGYGIITCTDINLNDILMPVLESVELPEYTEQTDLEFLTKYKINQLYFSAEGDLRKCKTAYIDEFFAEIKLIDDALDTCTTKTPCSKF